MKVLNAFVLAIVFIFLVIINSYVIFTYYEQQKIDNSIAELFETNKYNSPNIENQFTLSSSPFVLGTLETGVTLVDGREANLKSFIRNYYSDSPLFNHTDDIIRISDKYSIDYRLLPAIAMQESGLCKYAPHNSKNCWGFGIYGGNVLRFATYEEAMETVAKTLKGKYIDKGLTTPSKIMSKYTPNSNGSWAYSLKYFFSKLNE